MTYEAIAKDIKGRQFNRLYLLHGEEPYYVDKLTNALLDTVLTPDQREFDQSILYGKDSDVASLISTAKRYPMISDHHLVVLREGQEMKGIEGIESLLENIPETTILVLAFKKKLDGRKVWVKKAKKIGVDFSSQKIAEWHLAGWVSAEAKSVGLNVDQKGASMLVEFLGDDLHRISNELTKLKSLVKGDEAVNPQMIEKNIGISRDYNMFELQDALITRNVVKANRIIKYYAANPKKYPLQMVIPGLFSFYSKVLIVHASRAKTPEQAAKALNSRSTFYPKKILSAARNYGYKKTVRIVTILREFDMKSKGVGSTNSTPSSELMKEMLFRILH